MAGKYDDIIHLPRPVSQRHAPMTVQDRAAQFAPFAALTGYEEVIEESGRLTDRRIDLDEEAFTQLNDVLAQIKERLPEQPQVRLTWFQADSRKAGGAYHTVTGRVKKVDEHEKNLFLVDGRAIPLEQILDMELQKIANFFCISGG